MHPITLIRDAVAGALRRGELKHESASPAPETIFNPHIFHDAVWAGEHPNDPQFFYDPVVRDGVPA